MLSINSIKNGFDFIKNLRDFNFKKSTGLVSFMAVQWPKRVPVRLSFFFLFCMAYVSEGRCIVVILFAFGLYS